MPAFQLTNQLNHPVSNQTLAGHPYIAAFFFASCQSLCPGISGHMSKLQSELPASVKLVSFSVDPDHDTPGVLEAYGKKYGADDSRWYFLTGPKQEIYDTEVGVKLTAPGNGLTALNHSDRLLLIDATGEVRGVYESTDPNALKKPSPTPGASPAISRLPHPK